MPPEKLAAMIVGMYATPQATLCDAQSCLDAADLSAWERVQLLRASGGALLCLGRFSEAASAYEQAAGLAGGNLHLEALCRINLGTALGHCSRLSQSFAEHRAGIALAGFQSGLAALALLNIGILLYGMQAFDLSLGFQRAALRLPAATAIHSGAALYAGRALGFLGQSDEALQWLGDAAMKARACQATFMELDARSELALLRAKLGQPADQLAECLSVIQESRRLGMKPVESRTLSAYGHVLHLAGHHELAAKVGEAALAHDNAQPAGILTRRVHGWLAQALAARGLFEQAYRSAAAVAELAEGLERSADVRSYTTQAHALLARLPAHIASDQAAGHVPGDFQIALASGGALRLSAKDLQILRGVARGLTNGDIAAELEISPNTVRNRLSQVYLKIKVHDRAAATAWALRMGVLQ
jgi:DNA-binding NarL/FixJ family response regulator